MQDVPLIETDDGASASSDSDSQQQFSSSTGPTGPRLTVHLSDGSTVALGTEELQLALLAMQTFLLVYVTWKEASS